MDWNYDPAKYDPTVKFEIIPEGKHRLMIDEVEITVSKKEKPMIKVTFKVSGHNSKLWAYFVNGDNFQFSIDPFLDSFAIDPKTVPGEVHTWVGHTGAAVVEHNIYNNKTTANIKNYIPRSEQGVGASKAPETAKQGRGTTKQTASAQLPQEDFPFPSDEDMPF